MLYILLFILGIIFGVILLPIIIYFRASHSGRNITNWIEKEIWWRKRYKRITLSDKVAWGGRCNECSAATDEITCSVTKGHPCPCKWNQCLKYKKI